MKKRSWLRSIFIFFISFILLVYPCPCSKAADLVKGKEIKIALIDSGIDPKHPVFQGMKIGGYDFLQKRAKPIIDTSGHGTHMGGIIRRIAPGASIYSYRILDENGSGTFEKMYRAIETAIMNRVDVINLSLGDTNSIPNKQILDIINYAIDKNIIVVAGAGNKSYTGERKIKSCAMLPDVITVGASFEKQIPTIQIRGGEDRKELIPLDNSPHFPERTISFVDIGQGKKSANFNNVAGKGVLVKKSSTSLRRIASRAKRHGAVAVIGYNKHPGEWDGENGIRCTNEKCVLPTAALAGKYADELKRKMVDGAIDLEFSSINKDFVWDSSCCGNHLKTDTLKPDLLAPGVDIRSSVPITIDPTGYIVDSGTSQAAAYISGVVALLKEKYPDWGPAEVKAALMGTATLLTDTLHNTIPFTEQGAGKVNIEKALATNFFVAPSSLHFGQITKEAEKKRIVKQVTIYNEDRVSKTFHVNGESFSKRHGLEVITPPMVEVPAGGRKTIPITLVVDPTKLRHGRSVGMVWFREGGNEVHLPFLVKISPKQTPADNPE